MLTAEDLINSTYACYAPNKKELCSLAKTISLEKLKDIVQLASHEEDYACIDADRGEKCGICLIEGLNMLIYKYGEEQYCNSCYVDYLIENYITEASMDTHALP